MPTDGDTAPPIRAGAACARLIAEPSTWINRRVETIEILAHEETRRRVSIDFTLSEEEQGELLTRDGVVVPISLLSKAPRRNFDLRGESGQAIPVLGRKQNQELAQIALMNAALDALPMVTPSDVNEIAADLREIVASDAEDAERALGEFAGRDDELREAILNDPTCLELLFGLWPNYVLFAVVAPGGPARRVLKYSYGEDFDPIRAPDPSPAPHSLRERLEDMKERVSSPGRERFTIDCPAAHRAAGFHVEIAIPQELRIELAVLWDITTEDQVGPAVRDVNRASLYAIEELTDDNDIVAYAEITPERSGVTFQGAVSSVVVTTLLWLGVASCLDAENPGAAVSILLAGAALFSGLTAVSGEHPLVRHLFAGPRRWLVLVTVSALVASATLALEVPDAQPVDVWFVAAVATTLAALRLAWSAFRAPA